MSGSEALGSTGAGRRRPSRTLIAGLGLVLAFLLAEFVYGGLHAADLEAMGRVRVFLDGRSLRCADPADVTTVVRGADGEADGSYSVPAVRGRRGLDCRFSVVVQNDSDRTLDVERVTFPRLGARSGTGLTSDYSFTQGLKPLREGDADDAVFDHARDPEHRAPVPVAAHAVQRLTFHLRSDGCRRRGATTTWRRFPVVTATIGAATSDLAPAGAGFGFVGARTAAQPCG